MRKSTVARLLLSATAVTGLAVWAACGGSDAQDVVSSDAGGGQDTGTADTGSYYEDTGAPQDSGKPDTGKPDSGSPYDAGDTTVIPDPDGGDAGIGCFAGSELEQEPNDDKLTQAN